FTLREALSENFWTYPTILLGILVSGAHRPLRHLIDAAYPHRAPVAAAVVFLVLSALAIRTTAAFPLALIGALLALDTFLSRRSLPLRPLRRILLFLLAASRTPRGCPHRGGWGPPGPWPDARDPGSQDPAEGPCSDRTGGRARGCRSPERSHPDASGDSRDASRSPGLVLRGLVRRDGVLGRVR